MVVIFLRAFDLLFGLRKGEPMFRRLVPLWVIVSTILAGGSARAQMPFPVDLVPTRTALERLGLERQWFGVIPLVETERLMKITLAGDLMFAQTDYAIVHAFDAESGRLLWSAQLGERTGFARGVAANSFAVYVTNANYLHALDKKTGRPIWKHNLGTIPTSSPACDEDLAHGRDDLGQIDDFQTSRRQTTKGTKRSSRRRSRPGRGTRAARFSPGLCRPASSRSYGSSDGRTYVVESGDGNPLYRITDRRADRRGTRSVRDSAPC